MKVLVLINWFLQELQYHKIAEAQNTQAHLHQFSQA